MPITNTGLDVPAASDAFDPQVDIVALATSLNPRIVVPVANVSARTALAAALAPTPSAPLFVFRADANPGNGLEYTSDGTAWRALAPSASGKVTASTDAAGVMPAVAHGLGVTPRAVQLTLASGNSTAVNTIAKMIVSAADANNFTVTIWRSDTGVALATTVVNLYWTAHA